MPNRSKQRGTAFESLIVNHLKSVWDPRIERRTLNGALDKGDVAGFRVGDADFVLECKNHKAMDIGGWVSESEKERENANAVAGFVIHKRRGTADPSKQYVTTTVGDLLIALDAARAQGRLGY